MQEETMTMLTWALQHPYLYAMIQLKPAIVAVALSIMARSAFLVLRKK